MKSKFIVLLGIFILTAGCQKRKYPEEKVQVEEQDVYFDGYLNDQPIALKIGTDGYYCYASYKQNADNIYIFEGNLKKFDCNPCPLSLQIELSDYKARSPGSSIPVDSALKTGSRTFIPGIPKTQTIKFISLSNKEISSLRWNWSSGKSSQDSITTYEYGQPGLQTVSLTVQTKDGCESTVINKIFIGGENGLFACGIAVTPLQNNLSKFKSNIIGGKAPFQYTWNFGDGETSNDTTPNHDYKWAGSYPVKLQIKDAENHISESNSIHVAGNDKSSCTANISLSYEGSRNAFLNGARIQWTDQSNSILRSDSIAQPDGSYFEILNSQDYAANERGEPGRLLTLRFNVLLSDGTKKIWLKSENTKIAVTYK